MRKAHRRRLHFPPFLPFPPSSHIFYPSSSCSSCCCACTCGVQVPSLLPSSPRRFGPFHSLLAALDMPLVALFASAARNNSLSFLRLLFLFLLVFSFPFTSRYARRLSNVLGRALRVATRCAFLFFAKERKEAASAQSAPHKAHAHKARALCALLT